MVDYAKDREKFLSLGGDITEERPILGDNGKEYGADPHYLFMGLWAFKKIVKAAPSVHVDIGGDITMLTYLSNFVNVEHRDIRQCRTSCAEYKFVRDDITRLSMVGGTVKSLSCLHVAEHIGLGRYGDTVDPSGFVKACRELKRVLAPGGTLYFAVPVCSDGRVIFNAHRVLAPNHVVDCMAGLDLVSSAYIGANGAFSYCSTLEMMYQESEGCGLFEFKK
jgi:SAM-dependent methyltransferase